MAKLTKESFIESLKEMTLLEIKELVDAMKEEFGVDPSAVAVAAAPAAAEAADEKSTFDVVLTSAGANKIAVIKIVREEVAKYTNEHLDKSDNKQITEDDVFIVWSCKTLQNNKALASTTLFDGMYYEVTYNGDKNEIYFDAYKKWENKCISLD